MASPLVHELIRGLENTIHERLAMIEEVMQRRQQQQPMSMGPLGPTGSESRVQDDKYVAMQRAHQYLLQRIDTLEEDLSRLRAQFAERSAPAPVPAPSLIPTHPLVGMEVIPKKEVVISDPTPEPINHVDRLLMNTSARMALEEEEAACATGVEEVDVEEAETEADEEDLEGELEEEAEEEAEEAEAEEGEAEAGEAAAEADEEGEEAEEEGERMKGGNPDAAQLGIAASNDAVVDMTDALEITPDGPQIKLAEKPATEPVPEEPAAEPVTKPVTEEETETDIASEEASDVAAEGPEGEDPSIENPTRLPWDKSTATPSDTLIFRYLNTSLPKPISSYPAPWQAECRSCWKRKFVPFWLKKHKAGWESMMNKFAATLGSSGPSGLNGQNDQSSTIGENGPGPKNNPDAAQKKEGEAAASSGGGPLNNSGYAYY